MGEMDRGKGVKGGDDAQHTLRGLLEGAAQETSGRCGGRVVRAGKGNVEGTAMDVSERGGKSNKERRLAGEKGRGGSW